MRFLVGHTSTSATPHVYQVVGEQAYDLTAHDAAIGADLMPLI